MPAKPKPKSAARRPSLFVNLPPDLRRGLQWLADREGETISTVVRQIVRDKLKAEGWPG